MRDAGADGACLLCFQQAQQPFNVLGSSSGLNCPRFRGPAPGAPNAPRQASHGLGIGQPVLDCAQHVGAALGDDHTAYK